MATVLIAAYGSRGDILPLTDIGCRLREVGHDVVMTTTPDLVDDVEACGLQARAVEFDAGEDLADREPLRAAMQMVKPSGMRRLGDNMLAAVEDVPADIALLTPFAELAGHPLAEARDIPSLGLRLQPVSATSEFPPSLLGGWSAGRTGNRAAGRLAARAFDSAYGRTGAQFRARLGLRRESARALRDQRTRNAWPILHGISPGVLPRPDDWRAGLDVVGYWWPRRPRNWTPPAELEQFLDSGPAPVFIGLGSLVVPAQEAARLSETVREALHRAGLRGIVQSVQAAGVGLEVSDDDILTVGAVPHDWLLRKVSAVVHSCGAGTTAAGIRAGLPAVGVPSPGGDQPFWARRLEVSGVSAATLPRPKLAAEALAEALRRVVTDIRYRQCAQALASRVAHDDGAGRVVATVERLLGS